MTEQDNVIRNTDMPERFQVRQVPVKETEEGELEEEAKWIYKQAFDNPPVSKQVMPMSLALTELHVYHIGLFFSLSVFQSKRNPSVAFLSTTLQLRNSGSCLMSHKIQG